MARNAMVYLIIKEKSKMPGSVSGSSHPLNNQSSANFPVNKKNESKTSELTPINELLNKPIAFSIVL